MQAAVKEDEGDHLAAISLYLKGGLPARAAQVRLQQISSSASLLFSYKILLRHHDLKHGIVLQLWLY
jgi:hypothetical protein